MGLSQLAFAFHVHSVTALVSNSRKPPRKGKSKKAPDLAQDIDKAIVRLVEVAENIAKDFPEIRELMLEACKETADAGETLRSVALGFSQEPFEAQKRIILINACRTLLLAVTRLLCTADMADVTRLLGVLKMVNVRLEELKEVRSRDYLLSAFRAYGDELMKLAKLSGLRQADLLDRQRTDDLAAARAVLRKSGRMLLTASKAYVTHPDVAWAQSNRDYVMQQVREAVWKISDVVQATGPRKAHSFEQPGALAADLDELQQLLGHDAEKFHSEAARRDLQDLVSEIILGASSLANCAGTRACSRQRIFAECERMKWALQNLVDEYVKHSNGVAENVAEARGSMFRTRRDLSKQLRRAVVDHVSDAFMATHVPLLLLCENAQDGHEGELDNCALVFKEHCDNPIEVAYIACSMSADIDGNKMVKMSASQLSSLYPQVINAARTLAARPKSKVARENASVFRDSWLAQVRVLTDAVDDIIAIEDFLAVSESRVVEDVNRCVEAMQRRDANVLDRLAGAVDGRVMRVYSVVTAEMDNYEPGPYTDTVTRAVMVVRNSIMPQFVDCTAMIIAVLGRDPMGDIDQAMFIDAARSVCDGVQDVRKAVMMKNPEGESDSEEETSAEERETLLARMADAQARQRERSAYEQLKAGGKVQFEVHSEAADDPGYGSGASIFVNGIDHCPKKRGYNVVVLDLIGTVVASRAFDTSASGEGLKMAEFLDCIPDDHVVLVAVQETAGDGVEEAGLALKSVGAIEPVDPGYRCGWAFAGYKGAYESKTWVYQVGRPRYEGPVMISDMINTPAADMGKIQVEICSEGCEDRFYGRVSSIKVNGIERGPTGRGMNVVVLDSAGNYLLSKNFDTVDPQHAVSAGRRMSRFLDELSSERIVCVSSQESVGAGMDEARDALLRLGAVDPVSPGQNGSYAFLGYTGPQKVAWLKQVSCQRKGGPARIVELIRTPAADLADGHAEEDLAEYEPVPVEEYDFDTKQGQSGLDADRQASTKENARSVMRALPSEERAKIEKLAEGLHVEKNRLVTEVSKWDDQGNDIIVLAKNMCMIMMDMSDFTRGSGPLKTTMDVIKAAEQIARFGAQLNKLASDIAEKCPVSHTRSDLLAYLQRIALYSHQLTITARVKADVQMISGEVIVSGVDAATSLIQAAKNLMIVVVLTVKASYVASTKHRLSANPAVCWRMKTPAKKPLLKMAAAPRNYRVQSSIAAGETLGAVLSDFE